MQQQRHPHRNAQRDGAMGQPGRPMQHFMGGRQIAIGQRVGVKLQRQALAKVV